MELAKLAAEAFGPGRLEILKILLAKPARYTDLVRRLEMSEGEVSRNLQRLHAAGLVDKLATGGFDATPLARLAVRFEAGLGLAARHSEYFRSHDVHTLDERFLLRIDDLAFAEFATDPLEMMAAQGRVFDGIESRFDGICLPAEHVAAAEKETEQVMGRLAAFRDNVQRQDAKVRLVLQDEDTTLGVQIHHPISPTIQYRTVPVSRIDLAMSDENVAMAFAHRDGRMDYNAGFFGSDPRFLGFCREYFEFVWSMARPVPVSAYQAALARPAPAVLSGWAKRARESPRSRLG